MLYGLPLAIWIYILNYGRERVRARAQERERENEESAWPCIGQIGVQADKHLVDS